MSSWSFPDGTDTSNLVWYDPADWVVICGHI